jgi:protein-S-isoprenylcysteine O-methyltransferase Ste14
VTFSTNGERPPSRIPWPPLLFIAVIVGGRMLDHWLPAPWIPPGPAHLAGTVLIALGLANDVWCALTLRRHDTTILPHRAVAALVTNGPYRYSRNPIYVSELALTLGAGLLLRSPAIVLLIPVLFYALTKLAIEPEERHLREKFGEAFERFRARTPRWL